MRVRLYTHRCMYITRTHRYEHVETYLVYIYTNKHTYTHTMNTYDCVHFCVTHTHKVLSALILSDAVRMWWSRCSLYVCMYLHKHARSMLTAFTFRRSSDVMMSISPTGSTRSCGQIIKKQSPSVYTQKQCLVLCVCPNTNNVCLCTHTNNVCLCAHTCVYYL